MKIKLKPVNNRFKNLIGKFGDEWIAVSKPFNMSCFNGELGVTAKPINNKTKVSNFKLSDIETCLH